MTANTFVMLKSLKYFPMFLCNNYQNSNRNIFGSLNFTETICPLWVLFCYVICIMHKFLYSYILSSFFHISVSSNQSTCSYEEATMENKGALNFISVTDSLFYSFMLTLGKLVNSSRSSSVNWE